MHLGYLCKGLCVSHLTIPDWLPDLPFFLLVRLSVRPSGCLSVCLSAIIRLTDFWLNNFSVGHLIFSFTRRRSATYERNWLPSWSTPDPVIRKSLWQAFVTNWTIWSEQSEGATEATSPPSYNFFRNRVTRISARGSTQSSPTSKWLFVVSSTPAVRKKTKNSQRTKKPQQTKNHKPTKNRQQTKHPLKMKSQKPTRAPKLNTTARPLI